MELDFIIHIEEQFIKGDFEPIFVMEQFEQVFVKVGFKRNYLEQVVIDGNFEEVY